MLFGISAVHGKKGTKLLKALCIVIIVLAAAAVLAVYLLTYVPKMYKPLTQSRSQEVHPYLTHYLAPNFHNNIQLDRPFEVIVIQKSLNEIIVDETSLGWSWPYELNGVTFSAPSVVFTADTIVLMGTADILGVPVVFSISASPQLDEKGALTMNFQKITAGALNITRLAQFVASKIITEQLKVVERNQWLKDLEGALSANKPFDPVFPLYNSDRSIRLTKAEISEEKLVLGFEPVD